MISAIELKKYVISIGNLGIIAGKLCYEKKPCSLIPLKIDKDLEINFYYTILLFSLIAYLQVKSRGKFLLDIKKIAKH